VKGAIPVYDDPITSIRSIERLEGLPGVKILLSSWDSQKKGGEVHRAMADGKEIIRALQTAVAEAAEKGLDLSTVARRVTEIIGLPAAALPVISRTVAGHLKAMKEGRAWKK
jgi:hypothetical protein